MNLSVASPAASLALSLGEGPCWNEETRQLSCVDILGKTVYVFSIDGKGLRPLRTITTPTVVGAALPLDNGDFITCEQGGIFRIEPDATRHPVAPLPISGPNFRCNDAKIGPDGRLWVGVMHNDAVQGAGSLWAIDAKGSSQCLLEGLTIPNGMDWWEESFWFVDGPRPEIRRYNLDGNGLSDSGHAIATPDTPDGFTMDSNGNIWLAVWDGGKVVCLDQDGRTLHTVTVPSPHTTSVCIVENTLFITSARFALDHDTLSLHPRAGDLFSTAVPTLGRPAFSDFFTR